MSMYLKLFHGRVEGAPGATTYEGDALDDWGHCGPTFGPLTYVHTTYSTRVAIEFANDPDKVRMNELWIKNDVLQFAGHEYGDWSVYEADEPDLGCGSNPFFERCHGSDVCRVTDAQGATGEPTKILARDNVLISTGEHAQTLADRSLAGKEAKSKSGQS